MLSQQPIVGRSPIAFNMVIIITIIVVMTKTLTSSVEYVVNVLNLQMSSKDISWKLLITQGERGIGGKVFFFPHASLVAMFVHCGYYN